MEIRHAWPRNDGSIVGRSVKPLQPSVRLCLKANLMEKQNTLQLHLCALVWGGTGKITGES